MNAEHVINGWIGQLRLDARDRSRQVGRRLRAEAPASVPEPAVAAPEFRRRLSLVRPRGVGDGDRPAASQLCLGLA